MGLDNFKMDRRWAVYGVFLSVFEMWMLFGSFSELQNSNVSQSFNGMACLLSGDVGDQSPITFDEENQ